MGYYSSMEITGKIKKGKEKELKKEVERLLNEEERKNFVDYFLDGMRIEDGYIRWDDYECKWYNDKDFVKFIAGYIEPEDIVFYGEDREVWGYRIKKDGRIFRLKMIMVEDGELV